MEIYLDNIIFSLQRAGGISVVWQNLIINLERMISGIKFIESRNPMNIFRNQLKIPKTHIQKIDYFHPIISQILNPSIKNKKPFIFHSSYFRTCKNPNAINVTTVHDFIYEQEAPTLKQKIRIKLNYRAIRNSDAIVCISENTRSDLLKYLPDIDPNKVSVIYNGVSEDYKLIQEDEKYLKYKNYVLFVGGRKAYKNFEFVIDSLEGTEYKLLICGAPLSDREIALLEKKLPEKYKQIVYPSNRELNILYNSVLALAYPSSYEGFGIPILEAQRAGCPVIALNASSIPEVIGDTPLIMDTLTRENFLNKLDILSDKTIKEDIIEAGLINSKRFSWKKMAMEYYNLYENLIKNKIMSKITVTGSSNENKYPH